MYWAMSGLPTKPTALMSGWCRIASTASLSPCTTWNTPGGRPASMNSSARRTGADTLAVLALQQVRDPDAELDHLDAALDVTARVGHRLAVLGGQQLGELVNVVVDECDESHQYPGAALRIPRGPALLGFDGRGHRRVYVGVAGHGDLRLHPAGAGVEDVGGAGGLAGGALPIDEVLDLCGHGCPRIAFVANTCIS